MSKRTQLEDALKCIYNNTISDIPVTTVSLSHFLDIAQTKATDLTAHMQRVGLIEFTDNRISLTEDGKQYALQIIRAHRLWERYLAEETSLDPKEWHTKAEEYEHKISPEDLESLADKLGNPLFDPHGDPIPTAEGEYQAQELMNFAELNPGQSVRVMHMEDEPEDVYDELIKQGIYVGMELSLISKNDVSCVIDGDGRTMTLSLNAAANLSVEQIEKIDSSQIAVGSESLDELKEGEVARIVKISPMCRGYERRRLMDLGIVPNTIVEYYKDGMSGGLRAFNIRGTVLALRIEQLKMITIVDRKRVSA